MRQNYTFQRRPGEIAQRVKSLPWTCLANVRTWVQSPCKKQKSQVWWQVPLIPTLHPWCLLVSQCRLIGEPQVPVRGGRQLLTLVVELWPPHTGAHMCIFTCMNAHTHAKQTNKQKTTTTERGREGERENFREVRQCWPNSILQKKKCPDIPSIPAIITHQLEYDKVVRHTDLYWQLQVLRRLRQRDHLNLSPDWAMLKKNKRKIISG